MSILTKNGQGLSKGSPMSKGTVKRQPGKKVGGSILWMNWQGHYAKIIKAINKTAIYNTIFIRFFKNQDNLFISPDGEGHFGRAYDKNEHQEGLYQNGYNIHVGHNGFLLNGHLTADPTFIAKVVMHEGIHVRYDMAKAEGRLSKYPTAYRHFKLEQKSDTYEGDHQAMAEGNIGTLVKGMIQFDKVYGSSHSTDWYNAIAWMGSLTRATSDWVNMNTSVKDRYTKIQENETNYMNYLVAQAKYASDQTSFNKIHCSAKRMLVDWILFKKTRSIK